MSDSAVNAATNGFVADGAHRIRVSVMIRARRWEAYLVIPLGTLESRVGPVRALRTGNPERGGIGPATTRPLTGMPSGWQRT